MTFPEGVFEFEDFNAYTKAGNVQTYAGINCEKTLVYGLYGSGRGEFQGSTGTCFRLKAGSSTRGSDTSLVPPQSEAPATNALSLIRMVGTTGPIHLANFRVEGTDQGHNFGGTKIFAARGPVLIEDCLFAGWQGDNGAPPGETMGVSVYSSGYNLTPGTSPIIRRVEADGRFYPGGPGMGPCGITIGKSVGGLIEDCWSHDNRIGTSSKIVLYHTTGVTIRRVNMVDVDPTATSAGMINGECNTGTVIEDCVFGKPAAWKHLTWSNTNHSDTWNSVTYPYSNGTCLVKNPVWPVTSSFNGMFLIETWLRPDGGTFSTQTTPPQVVDASGQGMTWKWASPHANGGTGGFEDITSADL